jgi:hypothetical protein
MLADAPEWHAAGVYEVAAGVHRIPLSLPDDGLRAVNAYVIEDGPGVVLIDPGQFGPLARSELGAGLAALGHTFADVRRCLGHPRAPRPLQQRDRPAPGTGVAGFPGDGTQRWPAVHALDAAVLFRLALESAPAGTAWHAMADKGDAVRDIATVVGRRLGLPIEAVSEETFGPFGPIFAMDQPASSAHTRDALGWQPTHPSLLEDLENIQP